MLYTCLSRCVIYVHSLQWLLEVSDWRFSFDTSSIDSFGLLPIIITSHVCTLSTASQSIYRSDSRQEIG